MKKIVIDRDDNSWIIKGDDGNVLYVYDFYDTYKDYLIAIGVHYPEYKEYINVNLDSLIHDIQEIRQSIYDEEYDARTELENMLKLDGCYYDGFD